MCVLRWNKNLKGCLIFFALQRKTKGAAYINFTTHMYGLFMRFYNMFANGKAKAAAANFAATGQIGAVKAFEYAEYMFFCNASTIITYFN